MKFLRRRKPQRRRTTEALEDGGGDVHIHDEGAGTHAVSALAEDGAASATSDDPRLIKSTPGLVRPNSHVATGSSFRLSGKRNLILEDDDAIAFEQAQGARAPSKRGSGRSLGGAGSRRKSILSDLRSSVCSILSNADTVQAANFGSSHSRRSILSRHRQDRSQSSFQSQASFRREPSVLFEQPTQHPETKPTAVSGQGSSHTAHWALTRQSTEKTISTLGTDSTHSTLSSLACGSSTRSPGVTEKGPGRGNAHASHRNGGEEVGFAGSSRALSSAPQTGCHRYSPTFAPSGTGVIENSVLEVSDQDCSDDERNAVDKRVHSPHVSVLAGGINPQKVQNSDQASAVISAAAVQAAPSAQQQQQQPQPQQQQQRLLRPGSIERPAEQGRRRSSLVRIPDNVALDLASFGDGDDNVSVLDECSEVSACDLAMAAAAAEAFGGGGLLLAYPSGKDDDEGGDANSACTCPDENRSARGGRHRRVVSSSSSASPASQGRRPRRTSIERPAAQGRRRSSLVRIPDNVALLELADLDDDDVSAFDESIDHTSARDLEGGFSHHLEKGVDVDNDNDSIRTGEKPLDWSSLSVPKIPGDIHVRAESLASETRAHDCAECGREGPECSAPSCSCAPPPEPVSARTGDIGDMPNVPKDCLRRGAHRRSSLDSMLDDESVVSCWSVRARKDPDQSRRYSLESAQEEDVTSRPIIDGVSSVVEGEEASGGYAVGAEQEGSALESDTQVLPFRSDEYGPSGLAPPLSVELPLVNAPSARLTLENHASSLGVAGGLERSLSLLEATVPIAEISAPSPARSSAAHSSVLDRLQNLDHRRAARDASSLRNNGGRRRGSAASSTGSTVSGPGSTASSPSLLDTAAMASPSLDRLVSASDHSANRFLPTNSDHLLGGAPRSSVPDRIQGGASGILDRLQTHNANRSFSDAFGTRPQQSPSSASPTLNFLHGGRSALGFTDLRFQASANTSLSGAFGARPQPPSLTSSSLEFFQGGRSTSGYADLQAQTFAGRSLSGAFGARSQLQPSSSAASTLDVLQGGRSPLGVSDRVRAQGSLSGPFTSSAHSTRQMSSQLSSSASSVLDRIQGSRPSTDLFERLRAQNFTDAASSSSSSSSGRAQNQHLSASVLDRIQRQQSTTSILDRIQGYQFSHASLGRAQTQGYNPPSSVLDRIQAQVSHPATRSGFQPLDQSRPRIANPPTALGAPQQQVVVIGGPDAASTSSSRHRRSDSVERFFSPGALDVPRPSSPTRSTASLRSAPSVRSLTSGRTSRTAPGAFVSDASANTAPRARHGVPLFIGGGSGGGGGAATSSEPSERRRFGSSSGSLLSSNAAAATSSILQGLATGCDDDSVASLGVGPPTALYNAVSACAPSQTIRSLIDADPSSTGKQNGGGLTPLHCAIERYDTPVPVLTMLLEANPSVAALRNRRGHTPVDLLWKRFVEPETYRSESARRAASSLRRMMENAVADDACVGGSANSKSDDCFHSAAEDRERDNGGPCPRERARKARAIRALYSSVELREFWDLMTSFVRAAYAGSLDDDGGGRWKLLHAAAAIACPPLLLRFASALNPDHIRLQDDSGRTPLHQFAASTTPSEDSASMSVVRALLALNSEAASLPDARGRLPLSLAVESRRSWGVIRSLFLCNPSALTTPDAATGFVPFMTAAASTGCRDDGANIDIIFRLLRENPLEVLRGIH